MTPIIASRPHPGTHSVSCGPGLGASIQYGLLATAARVSRRWGAPGLGRLTDLTGRFFSRANYIVVDVFGGRKIKLRLDDGYWVGPILRGAAYEPEVGRLLVILLKQDVRFVDCGANIGYWSLFASTLIPHSSIVAIEAAPATFAALEQNARMNPPGFRCVQSAVWDEPDRMVPMAIDLRRHSWSTAEPAERAALRDQGFQETLVPTITLDDVTDDLKDPIVIKLDLEGGEARALRGALRAMERDVCFIYEHHGRSRSVASSEILTTNGFSIGIIDGAQLRLLDPIEKQDHLVGDRAYNLVAFRSNSLFARLLQDPGRDGIP